MSILKGLLPYIQIPIDKYINLSKKINLHDLVVEEHGDQKLKY